MTAAANPVVVAVTAIALKVTGQSTTRVNLTVSSGALALPVMPIIAL